MIPMYAISLMALESRGRYFLNSVQAIARATKSSPDAPTRLSVARSDLLQVCEVGPDWIDVPSRKADGGGGVMAQGKAFKDRQFTAEVVLWVVRWYLMFPISYR